MTVELQFPQFKLEGDTINDILMNVRNRTIAWGACVKANYIGDKEARCLKKAADVDLAAERVEVILKDQDLFATSMVTVLNTSTQDDIVRFVLVSMIDALVADNSDFAKSVLSVSHVDSALPYAPLVRLIGSKDDPTSLCAAYNLTLLLTCDAAAKRGNEKSLKPLYDYIAKLLNGDGESCFAGVQLLKELLQIKLYRDYYWTSQKEYFPPLLHLLQIGQGELQMKYYTTFSVWLLTFNSDAIIQLNEQYPAVVETLYSEARDAVKEKIVRLAIDALLNLINIPDQALREQVIKHYLLAKGLEITKQLLERKWADQELKDDLNVMSDTLDEAVATLTTFDEYANELKTKTLVWSPSHKSDEFWYENIDKFKENNWKLLRQLVDLLKESSEDDARVYQNQAIICFDVSKLIKEAPETARQLDKIGARSTIMNLMNSPNSNVKYEALRTTQQLVSLAL